MITVEGYKHSKSISRIIENSRSYREEKGGFFSGSKMVVSYETNKTAIFSNGEIISLEETTPYNKKIQTNKGNHVEIKEYNNRNELDSTSAIDLDSNGLIIHEKTKYYITLQGNVYDLYISYKFDNLNRITEVEYSSGKKCTYSYPSKYEKSIVEIDKEKGFQTTHYFYNEDGTLRKYEINTFDGYTKTIVYERNLDRDISKIISYNSHGSTTISEFRYSYDSRRNWIEKVILVDGKRTEMVKRTIIYNV